MTGFTAEASSPNSTLCIRSGTISCKPELTQRAANTSPLHPRIVDKKSSKKKETKRTKIDAFKGREAKLNLAIFQILGINGPQTIYQIHKRVIRLRELSHTRYASVNKRIRILAESGYVGNHHTDRTNSAFGAIICELQSKAYVALFFHSVGLEEIMTSLNQENAFEVLAILMNIKEWKI